MVSGVDRASEGRLDNMNHIFMLLALQEMVSVGGKNRLNPSKTWVTSDAEILGPSHSKVRNVSGTAISGDLERGSLISRRRVHPKKFRLPKLLPKWTTT